MAESVTRNTAAAAVVAETVESLGVATILVVSAAAMLLCETPVEGVVSEPADTTGATTSHERLSIRAVLVGPNIRIIWRSSREEDTAAPPRWLDLLVGRSNVVPHEYPNNRRKAASTTALADAVDDDDDDDDDNIDDAGGSPCGRSFRFPNTGVAADESVAVAATEVPVAVDIPSVVAWVVAMILLCFQCINRRGFFFFGDPSSVYQNMMDTRVFHTELCYYWH